MVVPQIGRALLLLKMFDTRFRPHFSNHQLESKSTGRPGELGEVLNGTVGGRGSEEEITLFKSLGCACVAAAVPACQLRAPCDRLLRLTVLWPACVLGCI